MKLKDVRPGQRVRVTSGPYAEAKGTVIALSLVLNAVTVNLGKHGIRHISPSVLEPAPRGRI